MKKMLNSNSNREMQVKTTTSFRSTPTKTAITYTDKAGRRGKPGAGSRGKAGLLLHKFRAKHVVTRHVVSVQMMVQYRLRYNYHRASGKQ